jgi:hypothetical protein
MDDFSERTATPRDAVSRSEAMVEPEEVGVMLRLHRLGWGTKRIANALACSRG